MVKRLNKACKYFPCHEGLNDCTFCYCPFYPCKDENLGKYVWVDKLSKNIWSCQDCNWIHKRKVVDDIFTLIRRHKHLPKVKLHRLRYLADIKVPEFQGEA